MSKLEIFLAMCGREGRNFIFKGWQLCIELDNSLSMFVFNFINNHEYLI